MSSNTNVAKYLVKSDIINSVDDNVEILKIFSKRKIVNDWKIFFSYNNWNIVKN